MAGVPSALNRVRTETALTTLLNHRAVPEETFQHRVYRLKPTAISRYFEVLVGGQRTSCAHIAQQTVDGRCRQTADIHMAFLASESFVHKEKMIKEQMTYCLMQAVFFYKSLDGKVDGLTIKTSKDAVQD